MKRALHITLITTAITLAVGLLVCAIGFGRAYRPDYVCSSVQYRITDADKRLYLSENELNTLLRSQDAYPVGKAVSHISMQRIEDVVRSHSMVRTAQCYISPQGQLIISITQRTPLLRVITADDSYIIDTDRLRMPVRPSIRDTVLVVIGKVGQQMARTSIADFAEWLQDNDYWSPRIRYLEVVSPHYIRLLPTNPSAEIIVLGNLDNYQDKLRKLRIYYENAAPETLSKRYKELDLRFDGQVIGRK